MSLNLKRYTVLVQKSDLGAGCRVERRVSIKGLGFRAWSFRRLGVPYTKDPTFYLGSSNFNMDLKLGLQGFGFGP